jgi:hypothetical protein
MIFLSDHSIMEKTASWNLRHFLTQTNGCTDGKLIDKVGLIQFVHLLMKLNRAILCTCLRDPVTVCFAHTYMDRFTQSVHLPYWICHSNVFDTVFCLSGNFCLSKCTVQCIVHSTLPVSSIWQAVQCSMGKLFTLSMSMYKGIFWKYCQTKI